MREIEVETIRLSEWSEGVGTGDNEVVKAGYGVEVESEGERYVFRLPINVAELLAGELVSAISRHREWGLSERPDGSIWLGIKNMCIKLDRASALGIAEIILSFASAEELGGEPELSVNQGPPDVLIQREGNVCMTDKDAPCPKCGGVTGRPHWEKEFDMLRVTCVRCGFVWYDFPNTSMPEENAGGIIPA